MSLDIIGVGPIADLFKDVIDKIWPDPAQKAEALLKIQELDNQLAQGQMAIDQAEAASSSLFVAGWRPAVGWACVAAFVYHLLLQPFLTYVMAIFGHHFPLPVFDAAMLNTILMGMLGLGTMRTVEKVKGV